MAAAAVMSMPVSGLHGEFTVAELHKTTSAYNTLPPDDDNLPDVAVSIWGECRQLLVEFGVENKFCFHLLHGHEVLQPGFVMLGQKLPEKPIPGAVWSRPMPIARLEPDVKNLHGHIYLLDLDPAVNNFVAYELREGPPVPMSDNDTAFVAAFRDYLMRNNLAKVIGLEMRPEQELVEFIIGGFGTVLVPPKFSKARQLIDAGTLAPGRTTAVGVGGGAELKGNVVSHEPSVNNGPHVMMRDSKAHPWDEKLTDILDTLRQHDAIIEDVDERVE